MLVAPAPRQTAPCLLKPEHHKTQTRKEITRVQVSACIPSVHTCCSKCKSTLQADESFVPLAIFHRFSFHKMQADTSSLANYPRSFLSPCVRITQTTCSSTHLAEGPREMDLRSILTIQYMSTCQKCCFAIRKTEFLRPKRSDLVLREDRHMSWTKVPCRSFNQSAADN